MNRSTWKSRDLNYTKSEMNTPLAGRSNASDTKREKISEFEGLANEFIYNEAQILKTPQSFSEGKGRIRQPSLSVKGRETGKYSATVMAEHF